MYLTVWKDVLIMKLSDVEMRCFKEGIRNLGRYGDIVSVLDLRSPKWLDVEQEKWQEQRLAF